MQKSRFQRLKLLLYWIDWKLETQEKSLCPILAHIAALQWCQNGTPCLQAINNMGVEIVMQQDEEEEENSNG